jgi:hypothetical protein
MKNFHLISSAHGSQKSVGGGWLGRFFITICCVFIYVLYGREHVKSAGKQWKDGIKAIGVGVVLYFIRNFIFR